VKGVTPVVPRFETPRGDARESYSPKATALPGAASSSISLTPPQRRTREGARVRAANTPVWAQSVVGGYPTTGKLDVRVLGPDEAAASGVHGMVFSLSPAADRGRVQVGVDYGAFAEAYGGNYGSRLKLVRMPECFLNTPTDPTCRTREELPSTNDGTEQTVAAEVTLDAAAGKTVLAAVADASPDGGKGGTYAATELKPSGSWTAGGNSGSFSYSYPIVVPPASSTLAPTVSLNYDSSSVDGQTATTQAQSSWVGDGWSTPRSYIEQTFTSCADDPEGSPSPAETNDRCYDGPILTISLNGSTNALVRDDTTGNWKLQVDDGSVVEHEVNTNNGSNTYNTDYWTVTTRDGDTFQFGRNRLPGWTSGKPETKSVDVVPVYSAHSTGPCYNSAGFSQSVCDMAYRWNLDYVTDSHGNAMAYYYAQDRNFYGRNNGSVKDEYVRDSHLSRIDYGFRDNGAYGTVPNQIVFQTGPRCLGTGCEPLSASTKSRWPDVPFDLICADAASSCGSWSPGFFSTVRLTSVVAKQWSATAGAMVPVDTYALTQTIPDSGDGNSPTLWLSKIIRTGHDTTAGGSSAPITLPEVSFESIRLANRVDGVTDGLNSLNRHRIQSIKTESGSVITVTYDRPWPCTPPVTLDPATNTRSCYPVYWTPEGLSEPKRDWFQKYAVVKVQETDPTGGAAADTTSYEYQGGIGWHFDENEVVKATYRTYGQFRGYSKVRTLTGDGVNDPQTLSETTYYRGMSKNNNSTVVNVTDSQNGHHEDHDSLAGQELETTEYLGKNGSIDSSTITSYWVSGATATRDRTGMDNLVAQAVAPVQTWQRQAITTTDTTTWRVTQTDRSYDANVTSPTFGLLKFTYSHTVPANTLYDRCATTTYATLNPARNLVGLVSYQEVVAKACAGFIVGSPTSVPGSVNALAAPAGVTRPDQIVSAVRSYYDDTTFDVTFPQAAAPSKGDVTMTRSASGWSANAYTWQTAARSEFDSYGRVTASYDANGNKTTTSYTMSSAGLNTGVTVVNAKSQSTTTTLDTMRGLPLTSSDINQVVVTQHYDAIGRVKAVWLRNRTPATKRS